MNFPHKQDVYNSLFGTEIDRIFIELFSFVNILIFSISESLKNPLTYYRTRKEEKDQLCIEHPKC